MKVRAAIVIVPVRSFPVVLALTEYATEPLPLPLLPDVILIQVSLLAADHGQPFAQITSTVPVPPSFEKEALDAES